MWSRCTTTTLLGVSFGRYRRPRRELLMGRHRYVPLRRLGGVRLRRLWVFPTGCFIWGLFETLWRRTDGTPSFCPLETLSRTLSRHCHVETYHWDGLATFYWDIVGCFIWDVPATSLGRTERSGYDVAWRLVAGWLELSISITNVFLYTWILKRI